MCESHSGRGGGRWAGPPGGPIPPHLHTPAGRSLHPSFQNPVKRQPAPQRAVFLEVLPVNVSFLEDINSRAADISVTT